ncbi:hypothetical protein ACK35Y_16535 [Aeromonas veronii]|uniref:hypothetical protein n=1 Tax=Aeromonas veronii TaxID=654 RepID=UPI003A1CC709
MNINQTCTLQQLGLKLEFSYDVELSKQKVKIISAEDTPEFNEEEFYIFDVNSISPFIKGALVEIKDDDGDVLGYLVTQLATGQNIAELPSLIITASAYSYIKSNAINEDQPTPLSDDFENVGYEILKPILLIHASQVSEYIANYMDGCELWGGFSHQEQARNQSLIVEEIKAYKGIRYPTNEQKSKILDSVHSNNSFDRFLKKYQLIELLYDYILIARLRTIDPSLSHFRHTMNSYNKDECETLKEIINKYVDEPSEYLSVLYDSSNYEDVVLDIFKKHSKDSNPLKDDTNWDRFWRAVQSQKLSFADVGGSQEYRFNKECHKDTATYNKGLNNIVAYWIYRVRCSIAHYKIGEFIFSSEHEEFVVKIVEKLLDEVLFQIFSNDELHSEISLSKEIDAFLEGRANHAA